MTITTNPIVNGGCVDSDGPSPQVFTFPFSAAGTYLVATGEMRLLGVFLQTSVVGSILIKDSIEGTLGPNAQSITTAVGSNVLWTAGTAPDYIAIYSGLHMVVTGANVGYVMFTSRES